MVPEGWEIRPLSTLVEQGFRNGFSPNAPEERTDRVVLSLSALTNNGFDRTALKPAPDSEPVRRTELADGDFLISRSNTRERVGFSAMFRGEVTNCSYPDLMMRFRPDQNKLNPVYLEQSLRSPLVLGYLQSAAAGTSGSMVKLTGKSVGKAPIPVPPLPEQRKIADILSTWDRAIETSEALLATARTQKRALMQTLLTGKRRFPEFEGQDWREVRLGEVGAVSSAGVDKKTDPNQPEVRLLNFLDVFRREFIFDAELDHVVTAPPVKIQQCNVKRGDVFFTPSSETRDEIAIPAVAAEDMPGVCYSYHVVRYRLKEDWDLNFRTYVFQTDDFRRQAYRLGDGSGQRYVISQSNFRQMVVRVPGLAEQRKIGAVLKAASEEVGRLESDIEKLRTEKKALMQQLLTGKRRVALE